jgi:outer membrane protein assembly factor BamB
MNKILLILIITANTMVCYGCLKNNKGSILLSDTTKANSTNIAFVYFASDTALVSLNVQTDKIQWKYNDTFDKTYWWQNRDSTNIYIVDNNLKLLAINKSTGRLSWIFDLTNIGYNIVSVMSMRADLKLTITDDKLLVQFISASKPVLSLYNIAVIDKKSGILKYILNDRYNPNIEGNKIYSYGPPNAGLSFYCDNLEKGTNIWTFIPQEQRSTSSSLPMIFGSNIIMSGNDYYLYSIDKNNGKLLWQQKPANINVNEFHKINENKILALEEGKISNFSIFNATDGSIIKHFQNPTSNFISYPITISSNLIYTTDENNCFAINMDTGALVWQYSYFNDYSIWNKKITLTDKYVVTYTEKGLFINDSSNGKLIKAINFSSNKHLKQDLPVFVETLDNKIYFPF